MGCDDVTVVQVGVSLGAPNSGAKEKVVAAKKITPGECFVFYNTLPNRTHFYQRLLTAA